MTTGEKIKALRKSRSMSQEELADAVNLSRQAVSRWEADGVVPETGVIIKLSEIFGVSTDYLLKENAEDSCENFVIAEGSKNISKNLIIGCVCVGASLLVWLFMLFLSLAINELRIGSYGELVNVWDWDFWVSNNIVPVAIALLLVFVVGVCFFGRYYFMDARLRD